MLDRQALFADLDSLGATGWKSSLEPLLIEKLRDGAHGKLPEWRQVLANLPDVPAAATDLDNDVVTVSCPPDVCERSRDLLLGLAPWRKGPFRIGNIYIDSEWRSDLKWNRVRNAIEPLDGRRVLDVGCGNGYYALRMCGLNAGLVIAVDPTLLFIVQHFAIRHFMPALPLHALPLRLQELPAATGFFDTTFSMGVLYHQRDPRLHLRQLRESLRDGGQLVLETLILPGEQPESVTPAERYARMRNVWHLPTWPQLETWLDLEGFEDIRLVDVCRTTCDEQRSTEWMPFESLAEALDPNDPMRTIEGLPAPRRAVVTGRG